MYNRRRLVRCHTALQLLWICVCNGLFLHNPISICWTSVIHYICLFTLVTLPHGNHTYQHMQQILYSLRYISYLALNNNNQLFFSCFGSLICPCACVTSKGHVYVVAKYSVSRLFTQFGYNVLDLPSSAQFSTVSLFVSSTNSPNTRTHLPANQTIGSTSIFFIQTYLVTHF
jgi:hypothetical protein